MKKEPKKIKQFILDSRDGVLSLEERTLTEEQVKMCPDAEMEDDDFKLFRVRHGNVIFGTRIQKELNKGPRKKEKIWRKLHLKNLV